jgi:hypothetical protein
MTLMATTGLRALVLRYTQSLPDGIVGYTACWVRGMSSLQISCPFTRLAQPGFINPYGRDYGRP